MRLTVRMIFGSLRKVSGLFYVMLGIWGMGLWMAKKGSRAECSCDKTFQLRSRYLYVSPHAKMGSWELS